MSAGTITRYWKTPIVVDEIDLKGITIPSLGDRYATATALTFRVIPTDSVIDDLNALKTAFLASMNAIAAGQCTPPVPDVDVEVQLWPGGYDLPAASFATDYIGWCILAASPAPQHAESGCLSFADPRAGSAMTAMPGLPWGRQVMVRPVPGAHAVVPGWLTSSVVPMEQHQYAVVAVATAVR